MALLLGPDARFADAARTLYLNAWLGRGIDLWVWAAVACFKAALLSGARETSTVVNYNRQFRHFFDFLVEMPESQRVSGPADLSPIHTRTLIGWLQKRSQSQGWTKNTLRNALKSIKAVLKSMFAKGFIPGEPSRFFVRGALPSNGGESRHKSLSVGEQERLAKAIKSDLSAVHHGRLRLTGGELQSLRFLLVAHRQGRNLTPLLELTRNALSPGILPGTVKIRTVKVRGKKVTSSAGRASPTATLDGSQAGTDLVFSLAEGAVIQQAIASTEALVKDAPAHLKNRVWLYQAQSFVTKGVVCLTPTMLSHNIEGIIRRHQLLGDDGLPLKLNLSRLRKSFFDRAFNLADGDLAITANLMGNTPQVAGSNYPSMNDSRKAEAAEFLNKDFVASMRVVEIKPIARDAAPPVQTPVSGCKDTRHGEHAPGDGNNHCDRFVMCLFCSSFAIVGSVEDLWRLFSFQAFAKEELAFLDASLGPKRSDEEHLEELRARYRIAVPYIDEFTQRQFPSRTVAAARAKVGSSLHPFWVHQAKLSHRARALRGAQLTSRSDTAGIGDGDHFGY